MSSTRISTLTVLFVVGALVVFGAEIALLRLGEPALTPPITLGVTLLLIGAILPALAWPIRQATKTETNSPRSRSTSVNPFYAMRVLLLAKAGSLTGSILAGAGAGVAVFFLGRMVVVWPSVWLAAATALGGVVLVVGSLLAERWCQIPPTDNDEAMEEGELA